MHLDVFSFLNQSGTVTFPTDLRKTYGKGKVQQKADLIDGTSIKYTTAKWLMPNGKCIDEVGITPDYEVKLDLEKLDDDIYSDSQILYALNNLVD